MATLQHVSASVHPAADFDADFVNRLLDETAPYLTPADTPSDYDRDWNLGFTLGREGEPRPTLAGYSDLRAAVLEDGYECGIAKRHMDEESDWAEYADWSRRLDQQRGDDDRDPYGELVQLGSALGHHADESYYGGRAFGDDYAF